MSAADDDLPWPPRTHRPSRNDLAAPATQLVRDREDYLGHGARDIGRRIADDQVELFVSGDPVAALQQQFERLAPEFVAMHDVGTSATLRLLGALASAAGAHVQRLSIRRQGQGVALAMLPFVEIPMSDGSQIRIYTTDADADPLTRQQLAPVLLGRSRLAVLMFGGLPPHALTTALQPLRDAIARGPWPNRDMLLLPLGASAMLAAQAARLVGASGVMARVTPQASRPQDAWAFISGAWNRLQGHGPAGAALNTELAKAVPAPVLPQPQAPTQLMDLVPSAIPPPVATPSTAPWADYAQRCGAVKGVVSCCIFDQASQRPLAHAGGLPSPERLALQGGLLLGATSDAARMLGLAKAPAEAAISIGGQHLLLRPVPGHPGIMLHVLLHANASDFALARVQIEQAAVPG